MQPIPTFRVANIRPVVDLLRDVGSPVERLLRDSRLPVLAIDDPEVFVPTHLGMRFCARAARDQGIEDLGWRSGEALRPAETPFLRRSLASGLDVRGAIEDLAGSIRAESPLLGIRLELSGEVASLVYVPSVPFEFEGGAFDEQLMVAVLVGFLRAAIGEHWRPDGLCLRIGDAGVLRRVPALDGVEILPGSAVTAIRFQRAVLLEEVASPRPEGGDRVASAVSREDSFMASFERILRPHLRDGLPGIQQAAEMVGVSVRTLQRGLSAEGGSYSGLCERLRRVEAFRLIADRSRSLKAVAQALGYADAANFTRAFHRWTGRSPRDYRRDL